MKDGRHIIWSNDIDYDDWREDLEEQYPDLTEAERMELMYELNGDYLDDERSNLDMHCTSKHRRCDTTTALVRGSP